MRRPEDPSPPRRIHLTAAALLLAASLTACSGDDGRPDGPTTTPDGSADPTGSPSVSPSTISPSPPPSPPPTFTPPEGPAACPGEVDPRTTTPATFGTAPDPVPITTSELVLTSSDGAEVPAVVARPAAPPAERAAIVFVHGGFGGRPDPSEVEDLAARGFVVVGPEYRENDVGGLEVDDVAAAAGYLTAELGIEPSRIALLGTSHGASIAALVAARFPEVAGAVVWAAGAADWACIWSLNEGRGIARTLERSAGTTPRDEAGFLAFAERSPLYWAHEVTVPVYLVHSEHDGTVPPGQSQLMAGALLAAGAAVEWHLASDRGHRFLDRGGLGGPDWAGIWDFLDRTIGT